MTATETRCAGSIAEVIAHEKKCKEEYERGYQDYMKRHKMTPYQQGAADAKRDLEREKWGKINFPEFWL